MLRASVCIEDYNNSMDSWNLRGAGAVDGSRKGAASGPMRVHSAYVCTDETACLV